MAPALDKERAMPELPTGCEAMWGRLTLLGGSGGSPPTKQRVVVKVYRTSLEHFAVVYPDKHVAKPLGMLNLKHSRVERIANCDRSFRIVQRSCDGATVAFSADSPTKLPEWLKAFNGKTADTGRSMMHHQLSLPVVEEDEEE